MFELRPVAHLGLEIDVDVSLLLVDESSGAGLFLRVDIYGRQVEQFFGDFGRLEG